jgi:hypothetical protein
VKGPRRHKDGCKHSISVAEHVIVPEAKNPVSGLAQRTFSHRIGATIDEVLRAIKLHDQAARGAGEVHNVLANRVLASELETTEPAIPQMLPDPPLSIGGALPQAASESCRAPNRHPHPNPRPIKGEGASKWDIERLAFPEPLLPRILPLFVVYLLPHLVNSVP